MFAWWGRTVYRYRFIVIGVMVALCLGAGIFGISLGKHVTQSGFFDDSSQSVKASVLGDDTYGRDRTSLVAALYKMYFLGMSQQDALRYMDESGYKDSWVRGGLKKYIEEHPSVRSK